MTIDRPGDNSSTQERNDILDSCSSDFFSLRPTKEETQEERPVDNGGAKSRRGSWSRGKSQRKTERCSLGKWHSAHSRKPKHSFFQVPNNDDSSVDPSVDNRVNSSAVERESMGSTDMDRQIVDKFRVC